MIALLDRRNCDIAGDDRLACTEYVAKHATAGMTGDAAAVDVGVRPCYYPGYADPPHEGTAGSACDAVEVAVEYDHHFMTPLVSSIVDHVPLRGSDRVLSEPLGPCGSGH